MLSPPRAFLTYARYFATPPLTAPIFIKVSNHYLNNKSSLEKRGCFHPIRNSLQFIPPRASSATHNDPLNGSPYWLPGTSWELVTYRHVGFPPIAHAQRLLTPPCGFQSGEKE
jgi:hypothetical protein